MERGCKMREVRQSIDDAFQDMPYPGDENIASENHCTECYQLARAFRGKHWWDITLDFIRQDLLAEGLPLFNPPALRFYLPAFLLISVDHYEEADMIPDYVLNLLEPASTEPESRFLDRFEPLTPQQKRAVRLFLEYLVEVYPDEYSKEADDTPILALERYWGDK